MTAKNLILIALIGLLLFAYVFLRGSPGPTSNVVADHLLVVLLACGSIAIANFLSFLIVDVWLPRRHGKQPSALLRLVISLILYLALGFIVLQILGQDATALFTTSALVTAITGFAAQATLSNFVEGIALRVDQPYLMGDRIIAGETEGEVVSITWRATTLRKNDGTLHTIPNSVMSAQPVQVIPSGGEVQRQIEFSVPVAAPPQQVIDTVYEALLNRPHPNLNLDHPLRIQIASLSADYRISYYPLQYHDSDDTDRDILRRVWYALHRKGFIPGSAPESDQRYLQLISAIELFNAIEDHGKKILAQQAHPLLFDAGETLKQNNLPPRSMFILVKGCISIEQQVMMSGGRLTVKGMSHRPRPSPALALEAQDLQLVARQLAQYIGPSAFFLTDAAAPKSDSVYWLYQQLAAEIYDLDQREEFLQHSPTVPVEKLQVGDFFGELCLFLDYPLPSINMVATVETELLAITHEAMAEALHCQSTVLQNLSQQLASHQRDYLIGTMQMTTSDILAVEQVAQRMRQVYFFPQDAKSTTPDKIATE